MGTGSGRKMEGWRGRGGVQQHGSEEARENTNLIVCVGLEQGPEPRVLLFEGSLGSLDLRHAAAVLDRLLGHLQPRVLGINMARKRVLSTRARSTVCSRRPESGLTRGTSRGITSRVGGGEVIGCTGCTQGNAPKHLSPIRSILVEKPRGANER